MQTKVVKKFKNKITFPANENDKLTEFYRNLKFINFSQFLTLQRFYLYFRSTRKNAFVITAIFLLSQQIKLLRHQTICYFNNTFFLLMQLNRFFAPKNGRFSNFFQIILSLYFLNSTNIYYMYCCRNYKYNFDLKSKHTSKVKQNL